MIAYLDSSAYLRLLLDEPGADSVLAAWAVAEHSVTVRLTYVEVRAGLSRARREGRLQREGYEAASAAFIDSWAEVDVFELDEELGTRAGELADAYGLRAGDAVQLAAALGADDVAMIAFDRRLRAAAVAAGLAIYPEMV